MAGAGCRSSASQQQRQHSGRHTRGRKCSKTVLSHGPAEGSQCSLLPQTPNHIQAPAALVQAGGRQSPALETREEGALAIAPPKAADGGRHRKAAQAGAGPGSARAARDGTWGNAASRAERHWTQDGPGQVTGAEPGQARGCEPHPTTKAPQQKQRLVHPRATHTPNLLQLQCSPSNCKSSCARSPKTHWALDPPMRISAPGPGRGPSCTP